MPVLSLALSEVEGVAEGPPVRGLRSELSRTAWERSTELTPRARSAQNLDLPTMRGEEIWVQLWRK